MAALVRYGLYFLIVFTPIAFGGNEYWGRYVFSIVAYALFAALLFRRTFGKGGKKGLVPPTLFLPLALFGCLAVFQMVPLPSPLLRLLSPGTARLTGGTHPISVYPDATWGSFLMYCSYVCVFLCATDVFTERREVRRVLLLIVLVAFFESFYGLLEWLSGRHHLLWVEKKWYLDSVTGTFVNRNHFAAYLGMTIPLVFGIALSLIPPLPTWRERIRWLTRGNIALAALSFFCVFVMAVALLFSKSRGGILSFFLSMGIMVIYFSKGRAGKRRAAIFLAVMFLVFAVALWVGMDAVLARFAALSESSDLGESAYGRWLVWTATSGLIPSFFFLGSGLGTFFSLFPMVQPAVLTRSIYLHAHNEFLETLLETGLVGAVLVGYLLYALFRRGLRLLKRDSEDDSQGLAWGLLTGLLVVLFHSFVDFSLHVPANALLFVLSGAALFSLGENGRKPSHGARAGVGTLARLLALLFLLLLGKSATNRFRSEALHRRAEDRIGHHISLDGETVYDFDDALHYLKEASRLRRGNAGIRIRLADVYGHFYGWALEREARGEGMRHMVEGERLAGTQILLRAKRQIEEAIKTEPANARARLKKASLHTVLSLALTAGAEEKKAAHEFERAVRLRPEDAYYNYVAGSFLLHRGETVKAFPLLRKALETDIGYAPDVFDVLWDEGPDREHLDEVFPQTAESLLKLARLLRTAGAPERAEREARKALEIDPDLACGYRELGMIYGAQEKDIEALVAFRRAVNLDTEDPQLHSEFAQVLLRQERYGEAAEHAKKAFELGRKMWMWDPERRGSGKEALLGYRLQLGMIRFWQGDTLRAIETFRDLLDENPDLAGAYDGVGLCYARLKWDFTDTIGAFRNAIELDPENLLYRHHLAQAFYATDLFEEALKEWLTCLERDPAFVPAILGSAKSYWKMGKLPRARAAYTKVLEIRPGDREALEGLSRLSEARSTPLLHR